MATRSGGRWRNFEDSISDISQDTDSAEELSDDQEQEQQHVHSLNNDALPNDDSFDYVQPGIDLRSPLPEFLGVSGLNHFVLRDGNLSEVERMKHFIKPFLPDSVFQYLADATNKRAEMFFSELDEEQPPKRLIAWKDTTCDEMKKLIGIMFYMGLVQKPAIEDYWSLDPLFHTSYLMNMESLSRDRFQILLRFLRFANYDEISENDNDALRKIRPFLNMVKDICRNTYLPNKDLTVDESMVLWRGRLFFRQYIPSKRHRYGIKLYEVCDAKTGYMWSFELHVNKTEHNSFAPYLIERGLSVSERIVVHLIDPLLDQGYRVVADNYFTSVRLATYLLERETLILGTLRANRGAPPELKFRDLRPNNCLFVRRGDVMIVRYCVNKASGIKNIYMLDTSSRAELHSIQRVRRGGAVEQVPKPGSVMEYNRLMGAIDNSDAIIESCSATRKSNHWCTKLGIHLLQKLLLNAFLVHRDMFHQHGKNFTDFQKFAVKMLIEESGRGRQRITAIRSRSVTAHVPSKIPPRPNRPRPSKRCRECGYSEGRRKETRYECLGCHEVPALCIDCFPIWHQL